MTLRVGLDARFASARYDGVGRYVVALAEELLRLDDPPALHVLPAAVDDPPRHRLDVDSPRITVLDPGGARRAESPWSHWEIPRLARGARLNVWHTPFPLAPLTAGTPSVVTLHDCIPERFPAYFGLRTRLAYRAAVALSLRRARLVIVPSQLSADDAQRYHRVPAAKLRVVPQGVTPAAPAAVPPEAEARRRLGLAGGYVLTVGRPRPHKGYALLVRALARLDAGRRPLLVRVGRADPRLPDGSEELAARLDVRLRVLTGITEAELLAVYRGATLVAIPSAVEGFGLPLLEALAAGVPVLASDIQPLRASGGAVARFVSDGEQAWAEALAGALDDATWLAGARRGGPAQAARFPWSTTAAQTRQVYAEAAR